MKKNITKVFIVSFLFLVTLSLSGCNVFKINLTPQQNVTTYSIVVQNEEGGTVTGTGTYQKNASVTLTASPSSGYIFAGWTSADVTVHTALSYTFSATQNVVLRANFQNIMGSYYDETENSVTVLELKSNGEYALSSYNKQNEYYVLEEEVGAYTTGANSITLMHDEQVTPYTAVYDTQTNFLSMQSQENAEVTFAYEKYEANEINGTYTFIVEDYNYYYIEFDGTNYITKGYIYNLEEMLEYVTYTETYELFGHYLVTYSNEHSAYEFNEYSVSEGAISIFTSQGTLVLNAFTMPDIYYNYIFYMENSSLEMEFSNNNLVVIRQNTVVGGVPNTTQVVDDYMIIKNYLFITDSTTNEISKYTYTLTSDSLTVNNAVYYKDGILPQFRVRTLLTYEGTFVEGLGVYTLNETVTLSILPRANFTFVGWIIDGAFVSTSNIYTFVITKNITVQPVWESEDSGFEPLPN